MKSRIYQLVLLATIFLLYLTGCKESPTQNYYNINILDSLSNPDVDPRVTFTNPADGSYGPYGSTDPTQYVYYPQITIQFNKLINLGNHGWNCISLRNEDGECPLTLISDYLDPFTNILVFDLHERYMAGKTYTLTIDSSFTDIHGKKLNKTFTAEFVPEPKFRVCYYSPTEDDIDPSQVSGIYLLFNSKIDATIINSLSISPHINGYWTVDPDYYYNDSMSVYFNITDTLGCNAGYTISLAATAKDRSGLPIDKSYQFSFKTSPFRVRMNGYSSYTGPGGFTISNYFNFAFNAFVDTSTVRNSISISPPISHAIWFENYGSGNYYFILTFDEQEFQSNTKYTIYLPSTIKSTRGEPLEEYSYSFFTGH